MSKVVNQDDSWKERIGFNGEILQIKVGASLNTIIHYKGGNKFQHLKTIIHREKFEFSYHQHSYLLTHAMSSNIGQLDISLKPALEGERGRGSCFRLPDTSPRVGTWRLQPKTTALLHVHQALVGDMLNHSKMESSLQLIIPAFFLC